MNHENKNISGFLTGFLIGGLVGGLIALLYAPVTGKRLRRKISNTKDDLVDDVSEYYEAGKEKAEDFFKESKKKAETIIDEAKKLVTK